MARRLTGFLIGAGALLCLAGSAGATAPTLQLVQVAHDLATPVFVTSTAADPTALYVVEEAGRIQRVVDDVTDPAPFLDITSDVRFNGNQGFLSMAFSPTYASDHLFFVDYVAKNGNLIVAQFTLRAGKPPKQGKRLLRLKLPTGDDHLGGQLAFGPDGMLYVSVGDGGCCADPYRSAQNPKSKLGKLLRAAPPFTKWRIAGFGLRNPWRFSFDSANGDLYIGDVGQDQREEIDYRAAADVPTPANYGWSRYEGTVDYHTSVAINPGAPTPLVFPVYEYSHGVSNTECCVIGGYVYRGTAMPDEVGRYFFADLCSGQVRSLVVGGGALADERDESITVAAPSSFGVDAAGELYVVSLGDSAVYRIAAGL